MHQIWAENGPKWTQKKQNKDQQFLNRLKQENKPFFGRDSISKSSFKLKKHQKYLTQNSSKNVLTCQIRHFLNFFVRNSKT